MLGVSQKRAFLRQFETESHETRRQWKLTLMGTQRALDLSLKISRMSSYWGSTQNQSSTDYLMIVGSATVRRSVWQLVRRFYSTCTIHNRNDNGATYVWCDVIVQGKKKTYTWYVWCDGVAQSIKKGTRVCCDVITQGIWCVILLLHSFCCGIFLILWPRVWVIDKSESQVNLCHVCCCVSPPQTERATSTSIDGSLFSVSFLFCGRLFARCADVGDVEPHRAGGQQHVEQHAHRHCRAGAGFFGREGLSHYGGI